MGRSEVKGGVIVTDDGELVRRALARDPNAFRYIMQRHNRRLYRIARSVLRDNTDAEDVVQKTYITAFSHLTNYRGEAGLGAWLSGIALNEALGRLRHKRNIGEFAARDEVTEGAIIQFPAISTE
jgi:RNA polymerase sigma-70 factor, ECF subfamily